MARARLVPDTIPLLALTLAFCCLVLGLVVELQAARSRRLLWAISNEQVAREGKTDKEYQDKNPLPLSATSTRAKNHAAQTKAQEANGECLPHT